MKSLAVEYICYTVLFVLLDTYHLPVVYARIGDDAGKDINERRDIVQGQSPKANVTASTSLCIEASKCTECRTSLGSKGCFMNSWDGSKCVSKCIIDNMQTFFSQEKNYTCGACPPKSCVDLNRCTPCSVSSASKTKDGCMMAFKMDTTAGKTCATKCISSPMQPAFMKQEIKCGECPTTCSDMKSCVPCSSNPDKLTPDGCTMAFLRAGSDGTFCESKCVLTSKQESTLQDGFSCGQCPVLYKCDPCVKCSSSATSALEDGCIMNIVQGTSSCESMCIPLDQEYMIYGSRQMKCGRC